MRKATERFLAMALMAYLAAGAALFFAQEAFLFPAPDARGAPSDARIAVGPIVTQDGERLVHWSAPPAQDGCPTLLWFHGNAAALHRERWRFARVLDAGLGLEVIAYRGYGGSTGAPGEAGLKLDAAAALAAALEAARAEDVVVMGTSLGSGLAVWLAAREAVGAVVLEAPYLSMRALVAEAVPIYPAGLLLRHPFRSDLEMGAVTEPVLAVHGSADRLIAPWHSEALVALAGGAAERVMIEGSDHNTLVRDGMFERAVWPFLGELYPMCGGLR